MEWWAYGLLALTVLAALLCFFQSLYFGIGPMPTSPRVINEILKVLPSTLQGKVADLGAGWGTLMIALAKKLPHCHIIGYEGSFIPYLGALFLIKTLGLKNLSLYRKNFFDIDLSEMELVTCYLYPGAMQQLEAKFQKELSSQALVISVAFALPSWKPTFIIKANDLYKTPLYFYTKSTQKLDLET